VEVAIGKGVDREAGQAERVEAASQRQRIARDLLSHARRQPQPHAERLALAEPPALHEPRAQRRRARLERREQAG
jgi:hypothetical protein